MSALIPSNCQWVGGVSPADAPGRGARRAQAELLAPMSPAPTDPADAAARDRLIAAGIVTGREPSAMAVLEHFLDGEKHPARRELLGDLLDGKGEG